MGTSTEWQHFYLPSAGIGTKPVAVSLSSVISKKYKVSTYKI